MNNRTEIQGIINYIEEHLTEKLTLVKLAQLAHYSEYHFHRLFQFYTGNTVMTYIRNRRLSTAAALIRDTDQRLLEIALECGFQSHETFTRSFRKYFGLMPSELRRTGVKLPVMNKLFLDAALEEGQYIYDWGAMKLEFKLVTLPAAKIIGYRINTTTDNGKNREEIPAFWQHYINNRLWENIPGKLRPGIELGICTEYSEDGTFGYIIGYEVAEDTVVPEGLTEYRLSENEYAVFTTPPVNPDQFSSAIHQTWDYAFGEWFPNSGFEHSKAPEIEWYDERCMKDGDKQMDIYIPVRRSAGA